MNSVVVLKLLNSLKNVEKTLDIVAYCCYNVLVV